MSIRQKYTNGHHRDCNLRWQYYEPGTKCNCGFHKTLEDYAEMYEALKELVEASSESNHVRGFAVTKAQSILAKIKESPND